MQLDENYNGPAINLIATQTAVQWPMQITGNLNKL